VKILTPVCSLLSGLCWAAEAQIEYPVGAAAADDGTVDVADRKLPGIWRIRDQVPAMFFRASKNFRTPLNVVRCVPIDYPGQLVAGDSSTREVDRFSEDGKPVFLTDNSGRCLWEVSSDGATQKWLRGRALDRSVGLRRFGDDLLIMDHHHRPVFCLQMPKTVTGTVFAIGVFDSDETDE